MNMANLNYRLAFILSNTMQKMLNTMIAYAATMHEHQSDKGGKPYILHPIRVMQGINPEDQELQCIAIGHDLLEDCPITEENLSQIGMTTRIIQGIKDLTKIPGEDYETYKNKVKSNPDAITVKIQDLIDNSNIQRLKGITTEDMDRIKKYHEFYMELTLLK